VEISTFLSLDIIKKKNLDRHSTTNPFLLNGWTVRPELFMGGKNGTPAPRWSISHYRTNVTGMVYHGTPQQFSHQECLKGIC
jgi:hypothetical protein